ncbi:MAG TPA: diacylglycerol kinase family lipid kinase [Elusimicrobiales bacterium]|nr:diacylglycerol kinase family lipid kinase [Elusimicrobiales bacterium]
MSYFFIINPSAGKKQGDIRELLKKTFSGRKILFEMEFTRARGHASELAARAVLAGFTRVVAVGGDGTIRETAASLIGKETALGILPCGSGNGLARNLFIPLKFAAALDGLFEWEARPIDAGLANGQPFFCASGVGLDAEIAHDFNSLSRRRGILPYVWYAAKRVIASGPRKVTARLDGRRLEMTPLLTGVLNGMQYGGGARMAPGAYLDDGLLDLCFIKNASLPRLLSVVPALFSGRLAQYPEIYETFRARVIELDYGSGVWYHLDGEDFFSGDGQVKLSVIPAAIKVLAPKPSAI